MHTAPFMATAVAMYEQLGFTRATKYDQRAGEMLGLDDTDGPLVVAYRRDLALPRADNYALGRSAAETERLILQHQIYGPITRQLFSTAGITRGMKVLDLGSGAGDVALLCADLVGPQGRVVGVDMNADILETARGRAAAARWTNIEFLAGDIRELDLDSDFDAVVGRWIFMYLPDPAALLREVRAFLRPGGIVAIQESANLREPRPTYPPTPLHDELVRWLTPPADVEGVTPDMGRRLYRTFLDAGLPGPQLREETPIGAGADWPGHAYLAASVASLLPLLEELGQVDPAEVGIETLADRLRAEAVERQAVQFLPAVVGAWSRNP